MIPVLLVLVVFFLYVVGYVVSILFSRTRRRCSRNPFCIPTQLAGKTELLTDPKARKAILKNSFKPEKVPKDLDCIIIGSGIGGLGVAGFLSLAGKRCLVVERHHFAGGCCHVFSKQGCEFDTGIHYIGDMQETSLSRRLLDQLTNGGLLWAPMDKEYDVVQYHTSSAQEHRIAFTNGWSTMESRLKEKFPQEGVALRKFFSILRDIEKARLHMIIVKMIPMWLLRCVAWILPSISSHFYYSSKSVQEVLDGLTRNDELKCVLTYCFGDYGVRPTEAPFSLHASLLNHFMRSGGYYPVGGSSEITLQLINTVKKTGGEVFVQACVQRLLLDESGSKVVGVEVSPVVDKVIQEDKRYSILAPQVVSACGLHRTLRLLPPEMVQRNDLLTRYIVPNTKPSIASLSLFVSFQVGNQELLDCGIKPQNVWCYTHPDISSSMSTFLAQSVEDAAHSEIPMLFISFPSLKDPSWAERNPNVSSMVVITVARFDWFQKWDGTRVKKRGDDYKNVKEAFKMQMLRQAEHAVPQVKDLPTGYVDMGTPLTNQFYLGGLHGEIYGLEHDMTRFSALVSGALRPDIGIPGLLLSGQDILCCGFVGALYGAVLCSNKYLNRNLVDDIQKVTSKLKLRRK